MLFQLLPHNLQLVAVVSPGNDLLAMAMAAISPGFHASALQALFLGLFALTLGALAHWRLRGLAW